MGEWVKRQSANHKHDYPLYMSYAQGPVHIGDLWKCRCGDEFSVVDIIKQYDQRERVESYRLGWTLYRCLGGGVYAD